MSAEGLAAGARRASASTRALYTTDHRLTPVSVLGVLAPRFAGPFMQKCMTAPDLDELNIEIIRNTLYKEYLETFHKFCMDLGNPTAEVRICGAFAMKAAGNTHLSLCLSLPRCLSASASASASASVSPPAPPALSGPRQRRIHSHSDTSQPHGRVCHLIEDAGLCPSLRP